MELSNKELKIVRFLISDEINSVRQWTMLNDEFSRGNSIHKLRLLEELLVKVDQELHSILFEEGELAPRPEPITENVDSHSR